MFDITLHRLEAFTLLFLTDYPYNENLYETKKNLGEGILVYFTHLKVAEISCHYHT